MNDRIQDINSILKDLFISAKTNNIMLNEDMVYSYLIQGNVKQRDLEKNVNFEWGYSSSERKSSNNFFGRWIEKFKDNINTQVFCSANWKYFCQFIGGNDVDPIKCVKLYIPLDYEHLYEGVNKIFSFLSSNNITHRSKVASDIRFDNVVVRLENLEDARKLQEFIDNDKYIQKGLIRVNSFGFSKNGVGYGYDGYLSYNSCVAEIIANYINDNLYRDIEDINFHSFSSYVDSFSKNSNNYVFLADGYSHVEDAKCVVELLKRSLKSNDLKEYDEFYKVARDVNKRRMFGKNEVNNEFDEKKQLFDELILVTMKKYPMGYDEDYPNMSGLDYINNFVFDGYIGSVTRDNNLRSRIKEANLKKEDVFSILENSGIVGDNIRNKFNNYIKMIMLNEMIRCSTIKFGDCGILQIDDFIKTNSLEYITYSVGKARNLAETLDGSEIKNFLADLGVRDIFEYQEIYYNNDKNIGYRRR